MLKHLLIYLKGLAMGAADVVPGVSGGTIAFITGIYDDLLGAINAVNFNTFKILRKEGIAAAWKEINGNFLVALFAGIATSFITLARVLGLLLETHPQLLWAFFFGLIIGSIYLVQKMVDRWDIISIIGLIVGTIILYGISIIQPGGGEASLGFIFLGGAIAICAMILPGISGSFILLILGLYKPLIEAINVLNIPIIAVFGAGAVIGLLSFSRLLKWILDNYRNVTIAILLGFLIGSLIKIWPWKRTLEFRTNSHGESVPFIQENILPHVHPNPQLGLAVFLCIVGFGIILLLSRFAPKEATPES